MSKLAPPRLRPAHKRRATGRGNANKAAIIKACNSLFGTKFDPEKYESSGEDNIADSAFVCLLTCEEYAAGLPKKF